MNKKILSILLILSISAQASLSGFCAMLFHKNLPKSTIGDLNRMDKMTRLDNIAGFFRKFKSNRELVEINEYILKKFSLLDTQIYQGKYAYAQRSWRGLFRNVEINYVFVSKQQTIIDDLKKMISQGMDVNTIRQKYIVDSADNAFHRSVVENTNDLESLNKYIKSSEKEIRKRNIQIGNNYHEYKITRLHLEELTKDANCRKECRDSVEYLLKNLGAGSDNIRNQYDTILHGQARPTINEIRDWANKTPIVYETRLFKEIIFEVRALIRDYLLQASTMNKLLKFLHDKFPLKKNKIVRIFNLFVDSNARVNHFPGVNDIVRKRSTVEEKYHALRELNAKFDQDEFLITFSRRVDEGASENWRRIKEFLSQSADQKHIDFLKRMDEADLNAKALGDLSLNSSSNLPHRFLVLLAAGGAGAAYFNFDAKETTKEVVNNVIEQVSNVEEKEEGNKVVIMEDDQFKLEEVITDSMVVDEIFEPLPAEDEMPLTDSQNVEMIEVLLNEVEVEQVYADTLEFHQVMEAFSQQLGVIQESKIKE